MTGQPRPWQKIRSARQALLDYGFTGLALKEAAAPTWIFRTAFEAWSVSKAAFCRAIGRRYDEATHVCQALRLLEGSDISPALARARASVLAAAGADGSAEYSLASNKLLRSFISSGRARKSAWRFRKHGLNYAVSLMLPKIPEDPRRVGFLVPLKPFDQASRQKGVLYLQYTESIECFAALYDLSRIAERYTLVLEPSWWGYQDESFLLMVGREFGVVVEAQDEADFEYIRDLRCNLESIRLGAGDWVDPDDFRPSSQGSMRFDFAMVANWNPVKRHALFFRSLAAAGLHSARVALIGYPSGGRTKADIECMAAKAGLRSVTMFESIPRDRVAEIVRSSRVGVMLSKREGANRGIYECLCSNVPVIVAKSNRGVNKEHINEHTGCLTSDEDLPDALVRMLDSGQYFSPRDWVLRNTGCKNAWQRLNEFVAVCAKKRGERYDRPIARIRSLPGIHLMSAEDKASAERVYEDLRGFLRGMTASELSG